MDTAESPRSSPERTDPSPTAHGSEGTIEHSASPERGGQKATSSHHALSKEFFDGAKESISSTGSLSDAGTILCQGPLSLKGKSGFEQRHFLLYEDRLEYLLSPEEGSEEVPVKYLALADVTSIEERTDSALGGSIVVNLTGGRHFQLLVADAATRQVWISSLRAAIAPYIRRASLALIDSDEEGVDGEIYDHASPSESEEKTGDGHEEIYDHAAASDCHSQSGGDEASFDAITPLDEAMCFGAPPLDAAAIAGKRSSSSPPMTQCPEKGYEDLPEEGLLHDRRRLSPRKASGKVQKQLPAWEIITNIEGRGNVKMQRSTGIVSCLRNIGFEPRVSTRDRPTAKFADPAQAKLALTDVANMARLLGTSVLIQVFTSSEPKRSARSMFHVDLADARARHVKDELRRLGAPGRLLETRCFWGHKACRELGLPHGARSFMRIQFDLGELRYGKVTTARLDDVEERGHIRINRGNGKITFVEDIEFSKLSRGAGAHSVKFKEQLSAEVKLRDVAELYRMSGMHMIVEAHSPPLGRGSFVANAPPSLLAALSEQVHVRAMLVKQMLIGLGVRAVNISARGLLGSHLNCQAIVIRTDLMLQQESEPGADGVHVVAEHIVDSGAPLVK